MTEGNFEEALKRIEELEARPIVEIPSFDDQFSQQNFLIDDLSKVVQIL
jgi:hypothetical protein